MAQTKTSNSFLSDKAAIRVKHLPDGDCLKILDCYGGKGWVWQAVQKLSKRNIDTLKIEIEESNDFFLPGDNLGYLREMNLSNFDVIDLDAYGVPYEQLKILFDRQYRGIVFVTFIQSIYGAMPIRLLMDIGFSEEMIHAIPTLFGKLGWQYFKEWLCLHGVKKIAHRSHARKHYVYFNCAG